MPTKEKKITKAQAVAARKVLATYTKQQAAKAARIAAKKTTRTVKKYGSKGVADGKKYGKQASSSFKTWLNS